MAAEKLLTIAQLAREARISHDLALSELEPGLTAIPLSKFGRSKSLHRHRCLYTPRVPAAAAEAFLERREEVRRKSLDARAQPTESAECATPTERCYGLQQVIQKLCVDARREAELERELEREMATVFGIAITTRNFQTVMQRIPRRVVRSVAERMGLELHFSFNEIALLWNLPPRKIRDLFEGEAGVLEATPARFSGRKDANAYTSPRVPERVLQCVYARLRAAED